MRWLPWALFCLLFCACLYYPAAAGAQEPTKPAKNRHKIALVLGGGGARGAAHVGVLKVLEQQRIPVDFIAGTSMGSIVGAAYAYGMSPEEIEKTLNDIDWPDIFNDRPPRQELSFRHKMDERRFTGLDLGFREGKLSLPRGAMAGRKLEFLLKSVFLGAAGVQSFDELPIPFRAVATDIETGQPVIVSSGSLALAVRASMSIPGAFSPVEIQGHLVDGYVANNVPVDVARQSTPDFIIAVDVGTPLAKREELSTMLDILNQVGAIATIRNVDERLQLLDAQDLLIRPDLDGFATTDFEKINEIIPRGEAAARGKLADLERYSVPPEDYQNFLARQRLKQKELPVIDYIRIAPTSRVAPERIESRITVKPGETLDLKKLSQDLDRIQAIDEFESVGFSTLADGDGTGLIIEPREKMWGPNYLRFGFHVADDFRGDAYYNVLLDHTLTSLNDLGLEWRNELQAGRNSLLRTELYQPLDYGETFFLAPNFGVQQDVADVYDGAQRIAEYRRQGLGGAAMPVCISAALQS